MAATASIQLSGLIANTPGGAVGIGPLTAASAAANGQIQRKVLLSGENVFTIPTVPAPTGAIVVLPSDNTAVTKFVGTTGDTGFAIGKVGFVHIPIDPLAVPASFILSSASDQTGKPTVVIFY